MLSCLLALATTSNMTARGDWPQRCAGAMFGLVWENSKTVLLPYVAGSDSVRLAWTASSTLEPGLENAGKLLAREPLPFGPDHVGTKRYHVLKVKTFHEEKERVMELDWEAYEVVLAWQVHFECEMDFPCFGNLVSEICSHYGKLHFGSEVTRRCLRRSVDDDWQKLESLIMDTTIQRMYILFRQCTVADLLFGDFLQELRQEAERLESSGDRDAHIREPIDKGRITWFSDLTRESPRRYPRDENPRQWAPLRDIMQQTAWPFPEDEEDGEGDVRSDTASSSHEVIA